MTDLRAHLADALWALDYQDTGGDLAARSSVSLNRWADVLLSLPGIIIADRDTLNNLLELHKPNVWNSAPFSRDGTTDDLCCLTCDRLGDRHTWTTPSWPCQTRQLLDTLTTTTEET